MSIGSLGIGDAVAKGISKLKTQRLKYNKKTILLTLIVITSGCFLYQWILGSFHFYSQDFTASAAENQRYISYKNYQKTYPDLLYKSDSVHRAVLGASFQKRSQGQLEGQLTELVGNAPIKEMVPELVKLDEATMALVVGIAKKESDWGRHAPSKNGKTCYNYWGYKGVGSKGFSMGYGCFENPEEGVQAISGLIRKLSPHTLNKPERMIVWKCGSSCAGHDPAAVRKWVQDVDTYYQKVLSFKRGTNAS